MDYRTEFGNRLKCLREKENKTQQDIANILGVDKSTYAHYESGRRTPDVEALARLAKYYQLVDELLGVNKQILGQSMDSCEKAKHIKYYKFPIILPSSEDKYSINESFSFDVARIYPTKQRLVMKIHNYLCSDKRVGSAFLFGSSVTNMCNRDSDTDIAIKLVGGIDIDSAKEEISEKVQEICDWNADILWRDRLDRTDRVLGDILRGVKIA